MGLIIFTMWCTLVKIMSQNLVLKVSEIGLTNNSPFYFIFLQLIFIINVISGVDIWRAILMFLGLTLILLSRALSGNSVFFYLCGIFIGVFASFMVLVYYISKMLPRVSIHKYFICTGLNVVIYLFYDIFKYIIVINKVLLCTALYCHNDRLQPEHLTKSNSRPIHIKYQAASQEVFVWSFTTRLKLEYRPERRYLFTRLICKACKCISYNLMYSRVVMLARHCHQWP